jgi:hypothetical protein
MSHSTIIRIACAAAAVAAAASITGSASAGAIGTDLNGSRIHWTIWPCYDVPSVTVNAKFTYDTPSAGYYETRLGLYTRDGARLGLGPLQDWTRYNTLGIAPAQWNTSSSYSGEAEVTAFVYRWNGTSYGLVARETINCW